MSIDYALQEVPKPGQTIPINDDLLWLRMPLPFALNHINLWLLRDGAAWNIVDTGAGDKTTFELWQQIFEDSMASRPANRIIATHMHPDHIGCAGFLTRHFDADLWITRDEYLLCRVLVADTGRDAPMEGVDFYRLAGFDENEIQQYQQAFGMFGRLVTPLPESYVRIMAGDTLRTGDNCWQIFTGDGHSPEHASLYDAERNLLIAGDQLLPTISSIVAVWPTEPAANPLREWFRSLRALRDFVPDDVLVLPAHGKPFRGAHERIDQLIREHEQRLDKILDCCRQPCRVTDTFDTIFKSKIGDGNRIMAAGEAMSHINYLIDCGQLSVDTRDGVAWFRAA